MIVSPAARCSTLLVLAAAACLAGAAAGTGVPVGPAPQDADARFRDEVLPLLQAQCFECHGPDVARPKGRLRLTGRAALMKGGASGPAIVPGDPAASLLIQAVRRTDPDLEMPPDDALGPEQVALLEAWVAEGAPWAGDPAPSTDQPPAHGAATGPSPGSAPGSAPEPAPGPTSEPTPEPTPEQARRFEETVRPLLAEHCFRCHGPEAEKLKGGLRMSGRASLLVGGESGPAIVPGDPDRSRLVQGIRYTDSRFQMPPDGKLPDDAIAALEAWVAEGAPWPGYDDVPAPPADEHGMDVAAGRAWWSFRPVERPTVPSSSFDARATNEIDRFVLARLEQAGLQPAPPADPATLVRRLSFDLLGLPPREEDLAAYAADPSPAAWAALVDELLARPEYGERWARHWLDVVRYAQTNGYERDAEKPYAWRFRDYVIDAFNRDVPWDRFVKEQVAGDELDDVTRESLIATGFYRLGVWDDEPDDPDQARYDELDDMVRTIGEGFLGVTLACARCHDHKFDPFRQEDYYATLAFVRNVSRYRAPVHSLRSATLTPLGLDWESAAVWVREREETLASMKAEQKALREKGRGLAQRDQLAELSPAARAAAATPAAERTPAQRELVAALQARPVNDAQAEAALPLEDRKRLGRLLVGMQDLQTDFAGSLDWALTVKEDGPWHVPTHVLARGRAASPGARVEPAFPAVLAPSDAAAVPALPAISAERDSLGRRRALAEWIASPDNPLTARVAVNRVWQHHFGRGLVPTPNDFGAAGEPPSHPELLDWLASEFVRGGWSVKHLHRLILTSATWRQASALPEGAGGRAGEIDPGNALLWRQNPRRLEAEALRDAVLSVSGRLRDERGGRGFFPRLPREVLAGGSRPGEGWEPATERDRERRSIYAYQKRNLADPLVEALDGPATALPVAARPVTTVPSQALVLLNGDLLNEQAAAFAGRVQREAGPDTDARIDHAWRLALSRAPTEAEHALASAYLERSARAFSERPPLMVFRADVPPRVFTDFLLVLEGRHILHAPDGWDRTRGVWGEEYNKTRELDLARGPVAFAPGPPVTDATLTAVLTLPEGSDPAGLVLRGTPDAEGDDVDALELLLLRDVAPVGGLGSVVRLVHHGPDAIRTLAEAPAALPAGTPLRVRAELVGDVVRVSVAPADTAADAETAAAATAVTAATAAKPLLVASLGGAAPSGRPGVRAWGEGVSLLSLEVETPEGRRALRAEDPGAAARALESFCLMLFNLNEFAYVD